jgi:hypothetical protein
MKQIQLVGDSHVLMHAELKEKGLLNFTHCGACTAYSLMDPSSKTGSFKTLKKIYADNPPEKNSFVFLFGEIDCRVLIYFKHIEHDISIKDMVDIAIYRYIAAVTYCRDLGYDVAIHGITPAVRQGNEYNIKHYANEFTRAVINHSFNENCKAKAQKENIPYFDCWNVFKLMGLDGLVPQDSLLPDLVHVDPKKVDIAYAFKVWLQINNFLPIGNET